jgi:hypothetical protein
MTIMSAHSGKKSIHIDSKLGFVTQKFIINQTIYDGKNTKLYKLNENVVSSLLHIIVHDSALLRSGSKRGSGPPRLRLPSSNQ